MIAALVALGGWNAAWTGVLGLFFDVSNERECTEYSLKSRVYGRMCIGPSLSSLVEPFRTFSASKRLKLNDIGESLRA